MVQYSLNCISSTVLFCGLAWPGFSQSHVWSHNRFPGGSKRYINIQALLRTIEMSVTWRDCSSFSWFVLRQKRKLADNTTLLPTSCRYHFVLHCKSSSVLLVVYSLSLKEQLHWHSFVLSPFAPVCPRQNNNNDNDEILGCCCSPGSSLLSTSRWIRYSILEI